MQAIIELIVANTTEDALLATCNQYVIAIDKCKFTIMIFVELWYNRTMKKHDNNQLWEGIQEGMRRNMYTGRVFAATDLKPIIRTTEELKQALGHRWRERLSNLAGLCHALKYLTGAQDGLHEFPVSCQSKGMLARFGTHQNASKVILVACEIGLLVRTNDYYGSGAGLSKCYIWDKRVEMLIMEFAKSEKIMPKMPVNSRKKSSKAIQNLSDSQQPPSSLPSPPSSNGATIPTGVHFGRLMRKATKEELYDGLVQSYP